MTTSTDALEYHQRAPKGKIATSLTKPVETQEDLSLAYSPGVATPCLEIAKDSEKVFEYTGKGNLVGVVSNGSAVLGLGHIGPEAAKPVMEGKAMLFKKFADIDVFDIEVKADDPDQFIQVVQALEPTFGGINLEDIKAPECFYIEEQLREKMNIPVFHDDQHGTAIISAAAFINALEITGRSLSETKVVFSGAGAAAVACAQLFLDLGVKREHLLMCDSRGVIYQGRAEGMNPYKERFAIDTKKRTLSEALDGADAFVGVSTKGILTKEMVKSMNQNPIIFALANPDPEIHPEDAREARPDAIIATGRSDFPNQVNNVLGFPFIFRGALDVRATTINDEMKIAAVYAIADLAKKDVPDEVLRVYAQKDTYKFGRDYLIPKPVDPRVLLYVAPAVAKAAMETGVARKNVDLNTYIEQIEKILGPTKSVIRKIRNGLNRVTRDLARKPMIVIPHSHDLRMIKAAAQIIQDGDIDLCMLGDKDHLTHLAKEAGYPELIRSVTMINPLTDKRSKDYAKDLFELRKRKGVSATIAQEYVRRSDYFGAMMVKNEEADGMVSGLVEPYRNAARPVLEVLGTKKDGPLFGVKILVIKNEIYFISDCTIHFDPSPQQLADIAVHTCKVARNFTKEPLRVAFLSFSSFGSNRHPRTQKMAEAADILKGTPQDFVFDGEVQADVATNVHLQRSEFPFCHLNGKANVLIFPSLESANIAYKLLDNIADSSCLGPLLLGLNSPVNIVERGASVDEIVSSIYLTAAQAFEEQVFATS